MASQVKIGGKTYILRLTMSGARLAQEILKKPFGEIFQAIAAIDLDAIRVLFYCATRAEHPELKLEDVDAIMDADDFQLTATMSDLKTALGNFFDREATKVSARDAAKKNGRGLKMAG